MLELSCNPDGPRSEHPSLKRTCSMAESPQEKIVGLYSGFICGILISLKLTMRQLRNLIHCENTGNVKFFLLIMSFKQAVYKEKYLLCLFVVWFWFFGVFFLVGGLR